MAEKIGGWAQGVLKWVIHNLSEAEKKDMLGAGGGSGTEVKRKREEDIEGGDAGGEEEERKRMKI